MDFMLIKLIIYLFEREQAGAAGKGEGNGGRGNFLLSGEPNMGIYPRTLGPSPEPKVDA